MYMFFVTVEPHTSLICHVQCLPVASSRISFERCVPGLCSRMSPHPFLVSTTSYRVHADRRGPSDMAYLEGVKAGRARDRDVCLSSLRS